MLGTLTLITIAVIAVAITVGLVVWLNRLSLHQAQTSFKSLQENFETFQRNLLVLQTESERSHDTKAAQLRSEISQQLQNNRKELQTGLLQTTTALESKVANIDNRLDARLKDLTSGVQSKLEQNLKEGFVHFEKVQNHLKQTELQLQNLNVVGQSINDLNNLLKLPHLRGNFGEALLESLLSDLLPVDAYELQYRVTPNSTERVDAVIKYPKQVLPIDSKFPREQVLPLFETADPAKLEQARKSLTEVMKLLGKQIKEKYIRPEYGTTEMALLFVPSETLYFEVLRNPKLCDELARNKVFAVSPNTLAVTLHAINMSRNYYEMAKGVEKTISEVKKAQQHFESFEKRFEDVGNALGKAQTAFTTATTHLSRYESAITRLIGHEEDTLPAVGTTLRSETTPKLIE